MKNEEVVVLLEQVQTMVAKAIENLKRPSCPLVQKAGEDRYLVRDDNSRVVIDIIQLPPTESGDILPHQWRESRNLPEDPLDVTPRTRPIKNPHVPDDGIIVGRRVEQGWPEISSKRKDPDTSWIP